MNSIVALHPTEQNYLFSCSPAWNICWASIQIHQQDPWTAEVGGGSLRLLAVNIQHHLYHRGEKGDLQLTVARELL